MVLLTNNHIKGVYFKNLDASRFFAFLLVFLAHGFVAVSSDMKQDSVVALVQNWGKIGLLGLEYFFVLSSFLISWIVLEERKQTRAFNVRNFLIRRSLRVWPLYFLIVALGYILFYVGQKMGVTLQPIPDFWVFGLFYMNFHVIHFGTNFLFFLMFLWSISIEEQFYLFWSLIMKAFKKGLVPISLLLIGVSLVFRYMHFADDKILYFHTLSAVGNFGVGGITAYIAFYKKQPFYWIENISPKMTITLYIVLLLSILFYHQLTIVPFFRWGIRMYFSLFFAFYIMEQCFAKNRIWNGGKYKVVNYLGRISYGLYCFHGVVITILLQILPKLSFQETYWHIFCLYPIVIVAFTILIASISYSWIEQPIVKLKHKFYSY